MVIRLAVGWLVVLLLYASTAGAFERPEWILGDAFPMVQEYSFRHPLAGGTNEVSVRSGEGDWIFEATSERSLPGLDGPVYVHELRFQGGWAGSGTYQPGEGEGSPIRYVLADGWLETRLTVVADTMAPAIIELTAEANMQLEGAEGNVTVGRIEVEATMRFVPPLAEWTWPLEPGAAWDWRGAVTINGEVRFASYVDGQSGDFTSLPPFSDVTTLSLSGSAEYAECVGSWIAYRVDLTGSDDQGHPVGNTAVYHPDYRWHVLKRLGGLLFQDLDLSVDEILWIAGQPEPSVTPTPPPATPTPTPEPGFEKPDWRLGDEWEMRLGIPFIYDDGSLRIEGELNVEGSWEVESSASRSVAHCGSEVQDIWLLAGEGEATMTGHVVINSPIRLDHDFRIEESEWEGELWVSRDDLNVIMLTQHLTAEVEISFYGVWTPIGETEIRFTTTFCPRLPDLRWPLRVGSQWEQPISIFLDAEVIGDFNILGIPFWFYEPLADGFTDQLRLEVPAAVPCGGPGGALLHRAAQIVDWDGGGTYCSDVGWYENLQLGPIPFRGPLRPQDLWMRLERDWAGAAAGPTPTPTPSPTPEPGWKNAAPSCRLRLSDTSFSRGDRFQLELAIRNPSFPRTIGFYTALAAGGEYFYHPDWTTQPPSAPAEISLAACDQETLVLLDFTWPDVKGAGKDFTFLSALVDLETGEVLSFCESDPFSYE